MIKPIPKLVYSEYEENNPFDINRLTIISVRNDVYGKPTLYFYLDDAEKGINWSFTTEKERSEALSKIYRMTNAVKI